MDIRKLVAPNLELMKGLDRATTNTVSALRTAVIVAQALANQKLERDQFSALNTTTGNLIAGTSEMLRDQSTASHHQTAGSTIDIPQDQLCEIDALCQLLGISRAEAVRRTLRDYAQRNGRGKTAAFGLWNSHDRSAQTPP